MRLAVTICVLLLGVSLAAAVQRAWKTGTWAASAEARFLTIETATQLLTAEAPASAAAQVLNAPPGTTVQYAIEEQTVYVLDAENVEHALKLVRVDAKYSSSYSAPGSGHYIRTVAPGGTSITLEDASRWDIDPRSNFSVADWQPEDLISVRRSNDDKDYAYEIDNTSRDSGALANYRVR
jgi:hypothetical protein